MKKTISIFLTISLLLAMTACGGNNNTSGGEAEYTAETTSAGSAEHTAETTSAANTDSGADTKTLIYGSGDYTRINPAMDEHGEINILIFNGLTAHDGSNQVVPSLA
ncbi:MAG: hypothetical protein NC489_31455, partial [Ruminococcus flavefaciens]|nr:hypothetical protein [Ruminococcus flavefaciens]